MQISFILEISTISNSSQAKTAAIDVRSDGKMSWIAVALTSKTGSATMGRLTRIICSVRDCMRDGSGVSYERQFCRGNNT